MSLRLPVSYSLADGPGRFAVVEDLTGLVTALDQAVQVRHVAARLDATPDGAGAAALLAAELTEAARPRVTDLCAPAETLDQMRAATALLAPAELEPLDRCPLPDVVGEQRDHLVLDDGRVGRVLALTSWPPMVEPDWLHPLADHPACVAVVMHLRPVAADVAHRLLRRRLACVLSTAGVDEQIGRVADPVIGVAAEAARELWDALARGETSLLWTQVLLGLAAPDLSGLAEATAALRRAMAGAAVTLEVLRLEQAPGWAALAPGGRPTGWPWRLLDAATVAATVPHPVGPPTVGEGTLVGVDPASGMPLRLDRFGLHNPTRLVVGTSGAGKSYATKLELTRQLAAGAHAVVVDPEGEFDQLGHVLGGLVLAVGEEPAGLDPVGLACRPELVPAEGLAVLATVARALLNTELGAADLALLDRGLTVLRADRGTTPTMADLLTVIADVAAHPPYTGCDLAARLAPAASGSLADLFAPNPELAAPPPLVVFDLRSVPARARSAVTACVLAWAWSRSQVGGVALPRLLVVDEAHLLLDDPPAAELLTQFARRARKYGVALDVVTQRLSDFLACSTGQAVLANAAVKLLLGCEDHERAAVADGLGLTPAEAALLRPGQRGHGLLLAPGLRTPVRVVAHPAEHALAATGPRRR